jgi:hypothetical protein
MAAGFIPRAGILKVLDDGAGRWHAHNTRVKTYSHIPQQATSGSNHATI